MKRLWLLLFQPACVFWLASCMLFAAAPAMAAEPTIVVVASERTSSYDEAIEALTVELARSGFSPSDITVINAAELNNRTGTSAKVVITFGTAAAEAMNNTESRAPRILALLPRNSYEQIIAGKKLQRNHTVVYLDQPISRQFDLLHLALPEAKRIGVIFGSVSRQLGPTLESAAAERGLHLTGATLEQGRPFYPLLQEVLGNSDLLLALADPLVFNANTIQNILLASFRARVPLLAFSPSYVKAGALLAIYSTPSQIGTQVGTLAQATLQGRTLPAPQYPNAFTVSVNQHVARSLGLMLNEASLSAQMHQLESKP